MPPTAWAFEDINLEEIDWHLLQPEQVIALVAALREDGYAPNTSSLYVNAVRGVMNEAWRMSLISQEHLLKIRTVKAAPGTRLSQGRNLRRTLIREMMDVCAADPRPQGLRDAAVIGILYGSGMRKSESVNLDLAQINFGERSLRGDRQGQQGTDQVRAGLGLRQITGLARIPARTAQGRRARRCVPVQPHPPGQPHHPRTHHQACDLLHRPPARSASRGDDHAP